MKSARKPRQIFRPNPVLGWSLTPGETVEVSYRDNVVQHIGDDGWRIVSGQSESSGIILGLYGCSFIYGTGLRDSETLASLVQAEFPEITVMNRGIGGHSSVQNLLQFRRDLEAGRVSAAIFGIISNHRYRNIPHPARMRMLQSLEWQELGIEHVPIARQNRSSELEIDYLPIWQPALSRSDFDAFLPNAHMIDMATVAVLSEIVEVGNRAGVHTLFALLDQTDPEFNDQLLSAFTNCKDVSTPNDADHSFRPFDAHPNALSNQIFAERLIPHVGQMIAGRLTSV
ncbi:hypothetical protein HFP51_10135 [Parasphingopyxis sp. CP4]|uniref:hypothetical protein n=1 Tax=Parasphingopyxis sp. CP4 TaxID=2724527 RepID=UPI0015A1EE83|nr:hypothetical protein [Parasphingopyxis sp. CP4]QLC22508.1 hypothetical protein HFP51_10135 [Parasphingopyxis sp. CP4]